MSFVARNLVLGVYDKVAVLLESKIIISIIFNNDTFHRGNDQIPSCAGCTACAFFFSLNIFYCQTIYSNGVESLQVLTTLVLTLPLKSAHSKYRVL